MGKRCSQLLSDFLLGAGLGIALNSLPWPSRDETARLLWVPVLSPSLTPSPLTPRLLYVVLTSQQPGPLDNIIRPNLQMSKLRLREDKSLDQD